jgi:hypothetical protein
MRPKRLKSEDAFRQHTRQLEHIFIQASSRGEMDDMELGGAQLAIFQLRKLTAHLAPRARDLFRAEIDALDAPALDSRQKLLILQRIYRTFAFLGPVSADE